MNKFVKLMEKVGFDRVAHLLVGFALTSIGYPYGWNATILACAAAMAVALVKELYDQLSYGGFDVIDMLWTDAGAGTAIVYFLISEMV